MKRITIEANTEIEEEIIKDFQIESRQREHKIKDLIMEWIKEYLRGK